MPPNFNNREWKRIVERPRSAKSREACITIAKLALQRRSNLHLPDGLTRITPNRLRIREKGIALHLLARQRTGILRERIVKAEKGECEQSPFGAERNTSETRGRFMARMLSRAVTSSV